MTTERHPPRPAGREQAWEERTAWLMFALSIVFLVASVWFFGDETLTAGWKALLGLAVILLWLVFIADYVVRLVLSADRRSFLRTRWFEAASLVLPYLRPFVILVYIWRLPWFHASAERQRARLIIMVVMFAFLFVYTASSLVWLVERKDPHANIVDLGDAIWWGFTTITTVGYGDFVPVTGPGRTIAVGLMLGGLVILGVTSATVISALNDQIRKVGRRLESEREQAHRQADAAPAPTPRTAGDTTTDSPGPSPV